MRKPRFLLPFLVVIFGIVSLGGVALMTFGRPPATRASLIGGPFKLTMEDGRVVTDTDFRGHPFLVFFGYTHCPDVCPTTLYELSQVLKAMGPRTDAKVLFITVDPARDTAKVMKAYLANFDPRIVGLSGTAAETRAVERAYRVYVKKVPTEGGDYSVDHTSIIYLMDKNGRFVSTFNINRTPKVAAAELEKYL